MPAPTSQIDQGRLPAGWLAHVHPPRAHSLIPAYANPCGLQQ